MASQSPPPVRCCLEHPVFATFGDVHFRRSGSDGIPVLTLALGEREAQLPLRSIRREFGITPDSSDGRMLDLIDLALDYVPQLQPGDRLPLEVLTGQASWKPGADHGRIAAVRLRLALVSWLSPSSRWARTGQDPATLLRLAGDAALGREVQAAATAAAQLLDWRESAGVVRAIDAMAEELAYLEALRERLLARAEQMAGQVIRLRRSRRQGLPSETLAQVGRLLSLAVRQFRTRFGAVDARATDIEAVLREPDVCRVFLRSNRDWLYRHDRAWDPVLGRWERADLDTANLGTLLSGVYQFLAPRFMPTSVWQVKQSAGGAAAERGHMAW